MWVYHVLEALKQHVAPFIDTPFSSQIWMEILLEALKEDVAPFSGSPNQ